MERSVPAEVLGLGPGRFTMLLREQSTEMPQQVTHCPHSHEPPCQCCHKCHAQIKKAVATTINILINISIILQRYSGCG
jgi:hypothetical protein